jgi:3-oxoacyl-[acyl-carrier protein] reductase
MMLSGKVGLVTGGASGFGAGIVKHFVDQGACVLILDTNEAAANGLVRALPAGKAHFVIGDVSSEASWNQALAVAIAKFGKLDIVVNNAGVLHGAQPATELSEDEFDRLFRINVKSLFWSTKVIVPYLVGSSSPGTFINISSTGAIRPRPNLAWYSATKGAVTTVSS